MARPRVICHMAASIDGRIVVQGWPSSAVVRREYDRVHQSYNADGWICGRVTMEPFAGGVRSEDEVAAQRSSAEPRDDFVAPGDHDSYAFAIDGGGRLAWESNDIDGDHVVAILSERVSDDYLQSLRNRGVSYVFAGAHDVDLALALEKVFMLFSVHTLMLEGGGAINGGFMHAGLIDEISVLVVPVVDSRTGTAALFDAHDAIPRAVSLVSVEQREDDVIWLRYRVVSA